MVMSGPHLGELVHGLGSMPVRDPSYLLLLAANVGA